MANLIITYPHGKYDLSIRIDNKEGLYEYQNDKVSITYTNIQGNENIEIEPWNELNRKHWIIVNIFYYLISIFGIFNKKNYMFATTFKYKGRINNVVGDSYLDFKIHNPVVNQVALTCDGNCTIDENETNKWFMDQEIINKRRKLKKYKRLIFMFTLIITLVFIIIK